MYQGRRWLLLPVRPGAGPAASPRGESDDRYRHSSQDHTAEAGPVHRGQRGYGPARLLWCQPRPGHAFIYIGNGRIVEVAPPTVRIAPAASHPDALWNAHCSLTAAQRQRICVRALALVGRAYDYPAYTAFALKVLRPRDGAELDPVFKADHWQVCSALVADCYAYAGIRLVPGLRDLSQVGAAGLDTWTAQSA